MSLFRNKIKLCKRLAIQDLKPPKECNIPFQVLLINNQFEQLLINLGPCNCCSINTQSGDYMYFKNIYNQLLLKTIYFVCLKGHHQLLLSNSFILFDGLFQVYVIEVIATAATMKCSLLNVMTRLVKKVRSNFWQ